MPKTVTLSDERLVDNARAEAAIHCRSLGAQIAHWAWIGRAIERSGQIDHTRIAKVLAGEVETTVLNTSEKVVWEEQFLERLSAPGPNEEASYAKLRASGNAVGLDASGKIVFADREPE